MSMHIYILYIYITINYQTIKIIKTQSTATTCKQNKNNQKHEQNVQNKTLLENQTKKEHLLSTLLSPPFSSGSFLSPIYFSLSLSSLRIAFIRRLFLRWLCVVNSCASPCFSCLFCCRTNATAHTAIRVLFGCLVLLVSRQHSLRHQT